ncbi:MAG: serine hydrolase domain-containing protein [Candidatus Binatia bacterium]
MPDARFFASSPETVGINSEKLHSLFERAEQEVREGLLPSVQIAIARRGEIAGMRTFGRVTHEGRAAAATNETLYVVFSATKALTSAAAWLLIQEGKLSIAERVADIIPEFGNNGKGSVTVEQLFTHTAGFPYAPFDPLDWHDRAKRVERFGRWKLNWEPGTRFEYHPTSSMWVVAELIERRSGMPFGEFVRSRVATVLGLSDLYVGLPAALHARVADIVHVGNKPAAEELKAFGYPDMPEGALIEDALLGFNQRAVREVGVPGGGGIMTAGDLALFYQALLADGRAPDGTQIWEPETIRMARQIRSGDLTDPVFRKKANRGLGIIVAGDGDRVYRGFGRCGSELMFGHNGAGGQIAWADPETGISIGYCTNGLDRNPFRQARRTTAISSRATVCAL